MKLNRITSDEYTKWVGLLIEKQKDSLIGQQYTEDSYFNPIQDNADNWVISVEEMKYCTNPDFIWVQELPLIEYVPKENKPINE